MNNQTIRSIRQILVRSAAAGLLIMSPLWAMASPQPLDVTTTNCINTSVENLMTGLSDKLERPVSVTLTDTAMIEDSGNGDQLTKITVAIEVLGFIKYQTFYCATLGGEWVSSRDAMKAVNGAETLYRDRVSM